MKDVPFIAANQKVAELSLRVILLAIILTVLLAMSNAYLALKLGILTSASIPAAIISMGILRFFKNSSILENNDVQTAASAGEAVAGGIVFCRRTVSHHRRRGRSLPELARDAPERSHHFAAGNTYVATVAVLRAVRNRHLHRD